MEYNATGYGTVFELTNNGSAGYTFNTLTSFTSGDGAIGSTGNLYIDPEGNLFGTTMLGNAVGGDGSVYEVSNSGAGYASSPKILVNFDLANGGQPNGPLIADSAGDLFGTTSIGGTSEDGTVFELSNDGAGLYSLSTLFNFTGANGKNPLGGLIADNNGDLFGTTQTGGTNGDGTVFELVKNGSFYTFTTLASFNGSNGDLLDARLTADASGDLFGTTVFGGTDNFGTVFEIAKTGSGYSNTPSTLVSFDGSDGVDVYNGVIIDSAGNLFGTTAGGSGSGVDGTVFEIPKLGSGYASTPITLAGFNGANGYEPGDLVANAAGTLFGVTEQDGANGDGTVFELTNSGFGQAATTSGGQSVGSLPNVQLGFTTAAYAVVQSVIADLTPSSGTLNVESVAAGGAASSSVAGALNAYVVTSAGAGAVSTVPVGYPLAYQLAGAASLQDPNGGTALIGAAAGATLQGMANDTLFGGNAGETLIATSGAETLFGGTGANTLFLGAGTDAVTSQGADTIVGTTGSATINASGPPIYFAGNETTLFNETGGSATLVGGAAETVNAGAANFLLFGGTASVVFNAGSGASTIVGGSGGNIVTGGSGATLYFGSGATTYLPGTAVDTVLGFTGSLTATGGANGTLFFTGTAGNSDVSTGAGSSTIIGLGADDLLTATGSGSDVIEAAAAAETINASASSGTNTFFAFGQSDILLGGSGSTAIESFVGSQTLVAGAGSTLFEIVESGTRALTISSFVAGQDYVQFQGYAANAAATALASATVTNGNETLALSDGTQVTFVGATNLTASSFL